MKFIVSRFYTPKNVVLEYLLEGDACYFDTVGNSRFVDFEFLVDPLCFSSRDRREGVYSIDGLDHYRRWIPRALKTPSAEKRDLLIQGKWDYAIPCIGENYPMYYDNKTNWICCGDPDQTGTAVQFTEQAIAVLKNPFELSAVWMKPAFKAYSYEIMKSFASATGTEESLIEINVG